MKIDPRLIGVDGEILAANYLASQGLQIVERHFLTRWGEIDLICRDRDTWVFVEVKARSRLAALTAADAISRSKQDKIVATALSYLKKQGLVDVAVRFDVVLIEAGDLEWISDAFQPSTAYTY